MTVVFSISFPSFIPVRSFKNFTPSTSWYAFGQLILASNGQRPTLILEASLRRMSTGPCRGGHLPSPAAREIQIRGDPRPDSYTRVELGRGGREN